MVTTQEAFPPTVEGERSYWASLLLTFGHVLMLWLILEAMRWAGAPIPNGTLATTIGLAALVRTYQGRRS
jgi:hypothetical protein